MPVGFAATGVPAAIHAVASLVRESTSPALPAFASTPGRKNPPAPNRAMSCAPVPVLTVAAVPRPSVVRTAATSALRNAQAALGKRDNREVGTAHRHRDRVARRAVAAKRRVSGNRRYPAARLLAVASTFQYSRVLVTS